MYMKEFWEMKNNINKLTTEELFNLMLGAYLEAKSETKPHEIGEYISERINDLKIDNMDNVKMFLFARWISTCYADSHLDKEMRCEHDEGFDGKEAISVLNRQSGEWYKEQLKHFNEVVYPNYIKNGSVENAEKFFKS